MPDALFAPAGIHEYLSAAGFHQKAFYRHADAAASFLKKSGESQIGFAAAPVGHGGRHQGAAGLEDMDPRHFIASLSVISASVTSG
jgi:hypothetical protein